MLGSAEPILWRSFRFLEQPDPISPRISNRGALWLLGFPKQKGSTVGSKSEGRLRDQDDLLGNPHVISARISGAALMWVFVDSGFHRFPQTHKVPLES